MTHLTFRSHDGHATPLEVPEGWSLMQAATANGVEGIIGECGGSCACATCHCYVGDELAARLPPPEANEIEMLANVVAERRPSSRLGCQIKVGPVLEGAIIELPAYQE
jgi:ferredoxin, 2Fe-2S